MLSRILRVKLRTMPSGLRCLKFLVVSLAMFCGADNDFSTYSNDQHFYFSDEPAGLFYQPINGTFCLDCSAFCADNGTIEILWRKDSELINNTIRRYVLGNGTLCVEQLNMQQDEGTYECIAKHEIIGTIVSSIAKLELMKPPVISANPQDVVAVRGESVRFQCTADAVPRPYFIWEKNGYRILDNATRFSVLKSSGVLQIVHTEEDDNGEYSCTAVNDVGRFKSSVASLVVDKSIDGHQREVLLAGPTDQNIILSQTVVLECFFSSSPSPLIPWTKRGKPLNLRSGRIRLFGNGNLEINNVQESDTGLYTCSWKNSTTGDFDTASANIVVMVPPRLVLEEWIKPRLQIRRTQVVRLTCSFDGNPEPKVSWLKDGRPIEHNGRIKIDDWELSITQSETTDSGMYQCRGENELGMSQAITFVEIQSLGIEPFPPVGLVATAVNKTSIKFSWEDSPYNVDRNVIAYSIHISPTKGGPEAQYVVQREQMQTGGVLEVNVLQPFTNYTVYAVAYNNYSGSDHSQKMTVKTGEDVPTGFPLLQLIPISSSAIELVWQELSLQDARGIVTDYKIIYRRRGSPSYRQVNKRSNQTKHVLTDLDPNTEYEIVVSAGTKAGHPSVILESTPWLSVRTKPFNQIGVPDAPEMKAVPAGSSGIFVNWTAAGNQNMSVAGFKLSCQRSGMKMAKGRGGGGGTVILPANIDKHIFTDLDSSTVYGLRLLAFNDKGESPLTSRTIKTNNKNFVDVLFDEMHLPPSPNILEAEPLGNTKIMLRWRKPDYADIVSYTVRYRLADEELLSSFDNATDYRFLSSLEEYIVIENLRPFSLYELSVQSLTSSTPGLFSSQLVTCRTEEGVPSEPVELYLTPYSPTSVRLHWNSPRDRNGIITEYKISFTTEYLQPQSEWLMKLESGNTLSTLLTKLEPSKMYCFTVQAATHSGGYGASARAVYFDMRDPATKAVSSGSEGFKLNDQDLGIIIGTTIGVTCIIICVVIIILRNRCFPVSSGQSVSTDDRIANGQLTSCHCDPSNCTAEYHVVNQPRNVIIDCNEDQLLLRNARIITENKQSDTKGGQTGHAQNGKTVKYLNHNNSGSSNSFVLPQNKRSKEELKEEESQQQIVPLLEDEQGINSSPLKDEFDLENIDYEDEAEDAADHDEGRDGSNFSRIPDDATVQCYDRLLGGHLPSRMTGSKVSDDLNAESVAEEGGKAAETDINHDDDDDDVERNSLNRCYDYEREPVDTGSKPDETGDNTHSNL